MKKILIVNSNYYKNISDNLIKSTKKSLTKKNKYQFNKCTWSL